MRKIFSTFILFHDRNSSPGFKEVNVPPHRWRQFLTETSLDILLAGGFPHLSPDLPFPVSPTLQINLDLTKRSGNDLLELANAELERVNSVIFSSRLVDADPGVCVLTESAQDLERFLLIYGGVLEIEPILIKGNHPDFPSAVEAAVIAEGAGYRVDFTVRVPLDRDRCTYCGACGRACPEDCLSEQLFVDFSRCTLCRTCEQVCPVQAIDLSAVETRSLRASAIVVLNTAAVDLPEDHKGIFTEETLPDFFATVSATEIQDVITCDNRICQYAGRLNTGCRLCQRICPNDAITIGAGGLVVDSRVCGECGACVSICPTGALQYERFTDRSFYRYFHTVRLSPGTTVIMGCEGALHRLWWRTDMNRQADHLFFLEHPNVRALSGMQLLLLFARGARRIVLINEASPTVGIDFRPSEAAMVNTLIENLFGISDFVVFCSLDDIKKFLGPENAHPLPVLFADPVFNGRRPALAAVLEYLVGNSCRQIRTKQESLPWFAALDCDTDRCSQCLACLNECKTAALTADQSTLSLLHTPVRCVACGVCVQVCPEKALQIAPELFINADFFQSRELARGEAMVCKECGKAFGTKKSYERVAAILARRQEAENGYLEYCETCRVAQIFAGT